MQRRSLFRLSGASLALGAGGLLAGKAFAQSSAPQNHAGHDHAAMMAAAKAAPAKPRKYDSLVKPMSECMAAVQVCMNHCQVVLATGDKSMGDCLRTALDCDVVCGAALKAAGLNSAYTPALAKTAQAAMEACVKSCKPHIEHHAECKGCHDACLAAIDAIRKMA